MIQFLHDPTNLKVEASLGAATAGALGLWATLVSIRREKQRDINRPETFNRELYAEDDVEEIVVDGEAPIPIRRQERRFITLPRTVFAVICASLLILGSWIGVRNYRILHCWSAAEASLDGKDFSSAETYSREAVRIDPVLRRSHLLLAKALLGEARNAQAIVELKLAAAADRADASVHLLLGDTLQSAGRPADAVSEYQTAIAVSRANAGAYVRLGSALTKVNRIDDAVKEFRYALQLEPNDVKANANLGCLLLAYRNADEGLVYLKRAVELDPKDVAAAHTLATAYEQMGRYADAARGFRDELAINPEYAVGYFNLAVTLKKMGDLTGAISAYKSYLRKSINYPDMQVGVPAAMSDLKALEVIVKRGGANTRRRPAE